METTSSGATAPGSAQTSVTPRHDPAMQLFIVERRLPGLTERGLTMLQTALVQATTRVAVRETDLRYLWSIFVPGQDRLLSLFASVGVDFVLAANAASLVPFIRVDAGYYLPDPIRPAAA